MQSAVQCIRSYITLLSGPDWNKRNSCSAIRSPAFLSNCFLKGLQLLVCSFYNDQGFVGRWGEQDLSEVIQIRSKIASLIVFVRFAASCHSFLAAINVFCRGEVQQHCAIFYTNPGDKGKTWSILFELLPLRELFSLDGCTFVSTLLVSASNSLERGRQ